MPYIKLNALGEFVGEGPSTHDVYFDAAHHCKFTDLTQADRDLLNLYPLAETSPPPFDPITQRPQRDGCELVDGHWQYKWTVSNLTAEQVAANQAAAVAAVIDGVTVATQSRLDAFARTRGYDGILSACTYASSAVPRFASDGQYAVNARDATWGTLYQFMTNVQLGVVPMPSGFAEIEPLLPALTWPA